MSGYICIHGHFYQPPRENPWLEAIETQDSAHPYHDWNERITAECYATNASSRVLDGKGFISRIVNNYSRISFNFGPTLLSWLETHSPSTYESILSADKLSQERFGGHGAAIAQVYNHIIMPLASERDRRTQIVWGLRDFEHRFGRKAEGMWLAETAVDLSTLELLAEYDVKFTILAPHQAARVRALNQHHSSELGWSDASKGKIDPTRPYLQRLPSGRTIAIFFYDGPISQAVAFERLLERGERLSARLVGALADAPAHPQLIHIATDGETYGHHHRHGEMALSYALELIERQDAATLTIYGEHLERYPPIEEVEIQERTAWSCAHGVERWRSDCGCSSGGNPGWDQRWRQPLRQALDWLRDTLAPLYERAAGELFDDPWGVRDAYIALVLDRSPASVSEFMGRYAIQALEGASLTRALELLELQRHAMLMYTSCGWFFDDISGIETVQILQYAARVIQLGQLQLDVDLEPHFLEILAQAPCNAKDYTDGRQVYLELVKPTMLQLRRVCAHYAIDSLFHETKHSYCYDIESALRRVHDSGRTRMAMGVATVTSKLTRRSETLEYAVLHLGDHNVTGGTRPAGPLQERTQLELDYDEAVTAFERGELPSLIRMLDRQFGQHVFTLRSLFKDEQRRVIERVMHSALYDAENILRELYENRAPLMYFLSALKQPLPEPFKAAATVALNQGLRHLLEAEEPAQDELYALLKEAEKVKVELDWRTLSFTAHEAVMRTLAAFNKQPRSSQALGRWMESVEIATKLPFDVSFWESQNSFMEVAQTIWVELNADDSPGPEVRVWLSRFEQLGSALRISPAVLS